MNVRRGPNFTMLLNTVSKQGLIYHNYFQGGITSQCFVEEITTIVDAYSGDDHPISFIADNASVHNLAFWVSIV